MTYKTILVHCDAGPKVGRRLAVAVELARRNAAHLIGVAVRQPFVTPAFAEGITPMDSLYTAYETTAKADEGIAAAAFAAAVKSAGLSTDWVVAEGYAEEQLPVRARYADLLVLGQSDPDAETRTPPVAPESVVLASGRPALVVPHVGVSSPPGHRILLCWSATRESARAATEALPLLRQAVKVIVLIVDRDHPPAGAGEPGADIKTWLARHGIDALVQHDVAVDSDVGGVILSRAADNSADLIVMGLYGHSRLRQMVLGGVSRTMLASMTVPVLMAH